MKSYSETSRIDHPKYTEAKALQTLLEATDSAVNDMNDNFEKDDNYAYPSFTINVGGISVALLLGGPQCKAIHKLVESIAEENGYEVNFQEDTVVE